MATTSQNGYSAPVSPARYELPGGVVPLRAGAAGALLAWIGRQFHSRVEGLVWPGCWGYAYRDIRGATQLSNHASGTALDLNAPKHPLGTEPTANFSAAQIRAIRNLVAQTEGCVRWGGDYTGRKDPMHFEINASEARCAAVLAKLTAAGGAAIAGEDEDMTEDEHRALFEIKEQLTGSRENDHYPGWQSFEYPNDPKAKATVTDFARYIDQNVIRLAKAVAALTAKVDELSKKTGSA